MTIILDIIITDVYITLICQSLITEWFCAFYVEFKMHFMYYSFICTCMNSETIKKHLSVCMSIHILC